MASKKPIDTLTDGWWRLFHSLLRHGRDEKELARSAAVWEWMSEHYLTLKKVAYDWRLDLLGAVWTAANENHELPSYEIVLEKVKVMEQNEELLDGLNRDYKLKTDLVVHAPEDMNSLLNTCVTDWETVRLNQIYSAANRIALGSEEIPVFMGKRNVKMSGPRDSVNYLLSKFEEGVLASQVQSMKPITVQNEARDVGEHFWEMMNQPHLETGIKGLYITRKDFLGILGYLGSGKSTVGRFILYQLALNGSNVLDISLENSQITERDKFVLLHAQHPKFNREFDSAISYRKVLEGVRTKTLTREQVDMISFVGKDFEETVEGRLVIQQPVHYTWDSIRASIEMQNGVNPLDACMIDYLSMIDPPTAKNYDDQRVKMSAMIKDVRSFGLHFDGGRGLCMISPVQANESGREDADADGVYGPSAVNNDKELGRSMTVILGVYDKGVNTQGLKELMLSLAKDREAFGMNPDIYPMSQSGWVGNRSGITTTDALDVL
jgi:ABC-type dipeptide/oligopeptide/nickel transport system ATPase subunit